ncbi:MAG: cytochrome P450 [Propionibacteriales bacterium]|nr:cytochrome P450 [Propionibacteriales bacterium]
MLSEWMVFKDPPEHSRLRRLIQKAFALRAIEGLRPRVEALVDELLDDAKTAAQDGPFDFMHVVAGPLPALVIAEMLGIPREDRLLFTRWSEDLASLVLGSPGATPRYDRARAGLGELIAYFESLLAQYRRQPADNLISALIHTQDAGESLTREEVLGTCSLVLFAGHETTSDLLGNATLALLQHPDQLAHLRTTGKLDRYGVEEFLRYEGPSKIQSRTVKEDFDFGGQRVLRGQRVLLAMASANRDGAHFSNPDRLDLTRTDTNHLGFGIGLHYCLGAALSRLEAEILLSRQFNHLPGLHLATDDVVWKPRVITRGLQELRLAA